MALFSPTALLAAYVLVFAASALGCLAAAHRARRIEDPDTRRGLVALLVLSGGWAAANVGFLLVPTPELKTLSYLVGLTVGFAAVGAWLYFCSAYTGRSLHRRTTIRNAAIATFALLVAVKLTNPVHGLYFSTAPVADPFPHLAVTHGLLHWLAMGLAYALAVVGYFMLYELFAQVGADARPLAALAAVTGLPVVLDVVGLTTPYLLDITYEPVGVAVFAVVVLFVYEERFRSIQLAGGVDEPVIVLTDDDHIRDYNASAADLFPALADRTVIGEPLEDVLPDLATHADRPVLELDRDGTTRYYHVSTNPFAAGRTTLGRLLTVADVTEREQYRRELERQNDRLERFASMVSHDLRNPLTVAKGRVEIERRTNDSGELAHAADALDRMETLIEDLLALARTGRPIDETEPVSLADVARRCFRVVEAPEAELVVDGDLAFHADPDRLQQLVENLLRNALEHGRRDATVRIGPLADGFYVEDDGPGIPQGDRERVFESGFTTAEGGTGFGLAIVAEIVEAHGWEIRVTEGADGGARFEVTGVTPVA